uniref:Putative 5.3 kDa protein n=1 Tax=Ixodes ricinus TaxID=34613 RepID=A0A6B0UFZ3_IXORI
MRALAIILISVVLLECFYTAECQVHKPVVRYRPNPPCRQPGGRCPSCRNSVRTPICRVLSATTALHKLARACHSCNKDHPHCRPPCPNCKGGYWTPYVCTNKK